MSSLFCAQAPRAVASRFMAAVQRTANSEQEESGVAFEAMANPPEQQSRGAAPRDNAARPRSGPPAARHSAKPFRGNPPRKP